MEKSDLKTELAQFTKASSRFEDALKRDPTKEELVIDASIQRFEFTYELCWKTLKRYLALEGFVVSSPKEVFQEAFRLGWLIEGDVLWMQMIRDQNFTSHTYDQKIALAVYQRIKTYVAPFKRLIAFLNKK